MTRLIPLDSGVVGFLISKPSDQKRECVAWVRRLRGQGIAFTIPDIVDFEVRREVIRLNASAQLARLDSPRAAFGESPVPTEAWRKAAEFWAIVRRIGVPTASPDAFDGDPILAALAVMIGDPGQEIIIATTNVRHLGRFPGVDARTWSQIA